MTIEMTVLGSADAFNSLGRGNACYLLKDGPTALCIDFGPTALRGLRQFSDTQPNDIDVIVLTHLHGDHFGGIHLFLVDADFSSKRPRPLTICGPVGTEKVVHSWYELAFGKVPDARRYDIHVIEFSPGETRDVLGRRMTAFPATHMGQGDVPLSFSIETQGRKFAFTGDTTWNDGLLELASGSDIFTCDCSEFSGASPQHMSWADLEPKLPLLKARHILLSHLGSTVRQKMAAMKRTGITLADDGMKFSVDGTGNIQIESTRVE